MQWEIKGKTSFPSLMFELKQGESIKSQPGSLLAMSDGIILEGKVDGGIGKAIGRMFSGENFFVQHIKAKQSGWAALSTTFPGDIVAIKIERGKNILVQKEGFLASTDGIEVSSKMQTLAKGIFSGEGLFIVNISGEGTAFLETFGSVYEINVEPGRDVIVDNGNLVAWEENLSYEITKGASSWFSAVTTGSGFVCKFSGQGKVWAQTCSLQNFAATITPYIPQRTIIKNQES